MRRFFLFKLGRKVWFSDRRTMRRNARIHSENKRVKMVKRLIICILSTMAFRSATSTLTLITRIHYLCTHKKKCIIIFCANKWRAATTKHTLSQLCEEERKKSCSQCFYLLHLLCNFSRLCYWYRQRQCFSLFRGPLFVWMHECRCHE